MGIGIILVFAHFSIGEYPRQFLSDGVLQNHCLIKSIGGFCQPALKLGHARPHFFHGAKFRFPGVVTRVKLFELPLHCGRYLRPAR